MLDLLIISTFATGAESEPLMEGASGELLQSCHVHAPMPKELNEFTYQGSISGSHSEGADIIQKVRILWMPIGTLRGACRLLKF